MRRVFQIALVIVMLGLSGPVWAGAFEDGVAAYNKADYATALQLLKPLATQGDSRAQIFLGLMFDIGQGVPQNYAEAMKWYRLAADQGDADAQHTLGMMFDIGQAVPQNYAEAMKWYRLAADQGNAHAQFRLGMMFSLGRGVPEDYVSAHMWCNLAASKFSAQQGEWRDKAVKIRDALSANMTPTQIAEAQRRATEWKPSPR